MSMEVFNLYEDGEDPGMPAALEDIMEPDVIAYWYRCDSYDGSGEMIYHGKEGWGTIDLGHCSCYGPGEDWNLGGYTTYPTLDELREKGFADEDLIDLLRAHGYR